MSENKWIKCSERLPDVGKEVLLYLTSKLKGVDNVITDGFIKQNLIYGTDSHDFYTRFYNDSFYDVTHWMPLPASPEQK